MSDGNAIIYCPEAFATPNGKTANGLVRRSKRYQLVSVVDPTWAGRDAGEVLDGAPTGVQIHASLEIAVAQAAADRRATHLVVGLAPDGGRLPPAARADIGRALGMGLHVVAGLHDMLGDDPELVNIAQRHHVTITDVRRTPPRDQHHFYTGSVGEIGSYRVAVLGTDSAVGKRTTAWVVLDALERLGASCELIGTGQTAWLQGARYGFVLDSTINDFVAGEIEHAMVTAWRKARPDIMLLEGQGSLLNPAYPGGFELLAAGRPQAVIMQHAPHRREYDGFPGHPLHSLARQIQAVQCISDVPVIAVTLNHEGLVPADIPREAERVTRETGLPCVDVLVQGADSLADLVLKAARQA